MNFMQDSFDIYKNTLQDICKVNGNEKAHKLIISKTYSCIREHKSLYETQKLIKDMVVKKYGEHWYCKSAEAVNHIIETIYSDKLREKQPVNTYDNNDKTMIWF